MDDKLCQPCEEVIREQSPRCPLQCGTQPCKSFKIKPAVDLSRIPIIWILGGPGSDKTVLCQKICAKYNFVHLSTADLLKAEVKSQTIRTKCLESVIARGELVPNDIVLELLKKAIDTCGSSKGYVVEGFPREKSQGFLFENRIKPVTLILYFEMTPETLTKRLLSHPNPCRDSNILDTVKGRLKIFFENNKKIVEQYPHRLITINAERDIEAVFGDAVRAIDPAVAAAMAPPKSLSE